MGNSGRNVFCTRGPRMLRRKTSDPAKSRSPIVRRPCKKPCRRECLGATLNGLFTDMDDDEVVYRASVTFDENEYEIVVSADGTLLEKSLVDDDADASKIDFDDCPEAVQKTLKGEAGEDQIDVVIKATEDDEPIYAAETELDGKTYVIKVFEDGTLLSKSLEIDKQQALGVLVVEEAKPSQKIDLKLSGKNFEIKVVDGGIVISVVPDDGEEEEETEE